MSDLLTELLPWLHNHASSVERDEKEIRFLHPTASSSILTLPSWNADLLAVNNGYLAPFYSEHTGASIERGHFVIGSTCFDGIDSSHGYKIPSLLNMTAMAISLGAANYQRHSVLMMQASSMFIYAVDSYKCITEYDRDYSEYTMVDRLCKILGGDQLRVACCWTARL